MYDELVKRLREEARSWCINCCYLAGDCICAAPDDRKKDCDIASKLQAADAIEELTGFVQEAERDRDEYRERLDKAADAIEELQATLRNWCAVCSEDKRDLSTCEIYESCRAKPPKEE